MSRSYSQDREASSDEATHHDHEAVPGRSTRSSQQEKADHPAPSGIVPAQNSSTTEEEKHKNAMDLERDASLLENRLLDLKHQIEQGAYKSHEAVITELKALHRELVEIQARVARARRLKKITKLHGEGLDEHLRHLVHLEGQIQDKAAKLK
jgi:hypothetical protein